MMQVGLNNYQFGNSNVMEKADTKKAEKKAEDAKAKQPEPTETEKSSPSPAGDILSPWEDDF